MFMENKDPKLWSSAHIYRSQWLQTTISGSIPSTTSKTMCISCKRKATSNLEDKKVEKSSNSHLRSLEHFDVKSDGTNLDFDLIKRREDDNDELSSGQCSMKFKPELEHRESQLKDRVTDFSTNGNILMKIEGLELNQRIEDPPMINSKFNSKWPVLKYQMANLTEDNQHQLVELVRRNDEKRETIRRLRLEVETLKRENKAIPRHSNADLDCNQSQMSRLGEIFMGKHFRGSSR